MRSGNPPARRPRQLGEDVNLLLVDLGEHGRAPGDELDVVLLNACRKLTPPDELCCGVFLVATLHG